MTEGYGGITADKVREWKAEHGRIIAIDDPEEMVFRKPTRAIWADFLESVAKAKGTHDGAYRRMCLACLLYPEQEKAEHIFNEYAALTVTVGDALAELAGHRGVVDIKKL